jgi:hypothetical protein
MPTMNTAVMPLNLPYSAAEQLAIATYNKELSYNAFKYIRGI